MDASRKTKPRIIPALSFHWLTPLYDPLVQWAMPERRFKGTLIERAHIGPRQHVLDLGCGTGTLALMVKQAAPSAVVTGLDADPRVLAMARRKAERAGVRVRWDEGSADDLPYEDRSFDVVLSSLMIHHLDSGLKLRAFREVRRVLKRGGSFHIVDFGPPFNTLSRLQAAVLRNFEHAGDNLAGRLPAMLRQAGFRRVRQENPFGTFFCAAWYLSAA